ncbi:hypothetical protein MA16_Dca017561 [Dendrobium catenatum]|uniref:Uncharacterized protein n=1 Tax=Dendrobium catenatum TaxID=906689 RepID=A0A2I0WKG2_9ASPA|nr:hypothetical protein MA16_Dca017561 [Dendrobium catenatum]
MAAHKTMHKYISRFCFTRRASSFSPARFQSAMAAHKTMHAVQYGSYGGGADALKV